MPTTVLRTRDGRLDAAAQEDLTALVQRLSAAPAKVLLHLHGGLVDEAHGVGVANRLAGATPDGLGAAADWEQIYIVWRTGPLETLKTNWPDLFDNDRIYKSLLKKVLGFAAQKLGVPGATGRSAFETMALSPTEIAARLEARGPGDPFADVDIGLEGFEAAGRGPVVTPQSDASLAAEFALALQVDAEFASAADDIAAALTFDPATGRGSSAHGDATVGQEALQHFDASIRVALVAEVPLTIEGRAIFSGVGVIKFLVKHAIAIALRVIKRFRTKRDHGFYATVVEELARELYGDFIGSSIWGMMKKDAADHFLAAGFGTTLMSALTSNPPAKMLVTAHSAGAIWATGMLKALAQNPGAPAVNLVLLAPAVRVDEFADVIKEAGDKVDHLRMYTMSDALERKDAVLGHDKGYIYPSSLLYLISGLFETRKEASFADAPLVGMQRFVGGDPAWVQDSEQVEAIRAVATFFTSPNHGIIYAKASGGPGLSTQADSHGGFDSEHATLASVATFLN